MIADLFGFGHHEPEKDNQESDYGQKLQALIEQNPSDEPGGDRRDVRDEILESMPGSHGILLRPWAGNYGSIDIQSQFLLLYRGYNARLIEVDCTGNDTLISLYHDIQMLVSTETKTTLWKVTDRGDADHEHDHEYEFIGSAGQNEFHACVVCDEVVIVKLSLW